MQDDKVYCMIFLLGVLAIGDSSGLTETQFALDNHYWGLEHNTKTNYHN